MKISIFINLILLVLYSNAIDIGDYCKTSSTDPLDSKCVNTIPYKCISGICAKNKDACEDFKELKFIVGSLRATSTFYTQINKFELILSKIKKCKPLSTDDLCLNPHECYHRKSLPSRTGGGIYILEKANCTCTGEFRYKCNDSTCSRDQKSCAEFFKNAAKLSTDYTLLNFKICNNFV